MKDLTRYATATATPTMEAFADFLIAEVYGGTLPEGIDVESFRTGVALGGSTRGYFQSSEAWKSDPRNYLANVETNRAKVAEERAAKAKVAAAKAIERERVAVAKLEEAVAAAKAKVAALVPESDESDEIRATEIRDAVAAEIATEEPTEEPTESVEEPKRGRRAA